MHDDAWRASVRATIGGSLAPAIVGVSRWMTPLEAWRRMRDARAGKPPPQVENDDVRRGKLLEPIALRLLDESIDGDVVPHNQRDFVRRDDWPWAHALPDGWVGKDWIVEVKVPRPAVVSRIAAEGPPAEYVVQCQHNIAVCRTVGCWLGVLDPVRMVILTYALERDEAMIAELARREREFFERVESGTPPAEDGRAAEVREPKLPPAPHRIETVDRDDVRTLVREYVALTEAEQEIADAKREIVAKFDELLGGVEVCEVPGISYRGADRVRIYRTETKPRRTFDWRAAVAVHPELNEDRFWKVGKPSRPFRMFPVKAGGES